jgi:hypothetical protein
MSFNIWMNKCCPPQDANTIVLNPWKELAKRRQSSKLLPG